MEDPPKDDDTEGPGALPPDLRFLRRLVTVLTVVMIGGVITIVALLVIRLNAPATPVFVAPGDFAVPEAVGVTGIAVMGDLTVLTGTDGVIRVYDSATRALVREIPVDAE